jgi:hypothetical protein
LLTNHTFVTRRSHTADFGLLKISASLFAPAPHPSPIPLWPVPSRSRSNEEDDDLDSNDSGVETEPELLNEVQLAELAQRFPSNTNVPEAVAIEVRQFFFLASWLRLIDAL